ncbi:MAG: TonB-dependent receptor [Betaproteobacteria bacterium]
MGNPNFLRKPLWIATGVVAGLAALPALAADIKVDVTGSNIKRVEGEGALPVQTMTREDIERTGSTSVGELLQYITANSPGGFAGTSTIGSTTFGLATANLRGLGGGRTLVLLNGRRMTQFSGETLANGSAVDVNAIPFGAIERIEILKDGASAVYGTDAIAGVVNFILRQDYQGAEASVYYGQSTRTGGADNTAVKAAAGFGDLARDRYNVFVSLNWQDQKPLYARDRDFANTSIIPAAGLDGTSGNTFPGTISTGGSRTPGYPNCAPSVVDEYSFPGSPRCRYDPQVVAQLIPQLTVSSAFASARYQIAPDWQAFLTAAFSESKNHSIIQPVPLSDQFDTPAVNPIFPQYPTNFILLPPSSPYYPHAAAIANGVDGQPLNIRYRAVENGNRDMTDTAEQSQIVAGIKGNFKGWDINSAFVWGQNKTKEHTNDGFPLLSKILPLLNSGRVNLFGPNTPAIVQEVKATNYVGDTYNNKTSSTGIDFKASSEIWQLPAGGLALAAGAEARRDNFAQTPSLAILQGDVAGYGGDAQVVDKSRSVWAAFVEFNVPITKTIEGNVAVRYDHYSDFGGTTNPKVSLRWQPTKEILVRGSYGTGFLAPSLFQMHAANTQGVTPSGVSDPLRCPVTKDGNDCLTQFTVVNGGNPTLKPENSEQINFGAVWEPVKGLSIGVDVFKINLSGTIVAGIGSDFILDHLDQYGNLVTRGPVQPQFPNLPGPIRVIDQRNINLGNAHILGADFDVSYALPPTPVGRFRIGVAGTYFDRYDISNPDKTYNGTVSNPGNSPATANAAGFTPRYKQYATLTWDYGMWSATLGNLYQSSYIDFNPGDDGNPRQVGTMSLWDLQATYKGIRNVTLTLGAKNLLDTNPPLTNQRITFQSGYDPSYYDARARFAYGSIAYAFK